ncbi:hypothetical protein IFM89_025112 [Coptis chinensis]|uniref:Uncharacterized protein n=1 Tax=Coptis chinensis TaxID=261450 RepID=A0A835HXY5_9MAGN|nr:hypothetical protein IFM89_025112 [Coptis chinensis]
MEDIVAVGFEEGRVWLPTHVLDEAFESKENRWPQQEQRRYHRTMDPSVDKIHRNNHPFNKSNPKFHSRTKLQSSRGPGGTGMQAIFLDSSQKPCGTGFFLPQMIGNNSQMSKKPICSPVLLPARVIHALNLDVHTLASQISPRKNPDSNLKRRIRGSKLGIEELESKVTTQSCVASAVRRTSPEIYLPKEWSY